MNKNFNNLTPAETERLAILSEECGEVIMAIGKILRHGYESTNPDVADHQGNRVDLAIEIGDVLAAIRLIEDAGDVRRSLVSTAVEIKFQKLRRQYVHHQEEK